MADKITFTSICNNTIIDILNYDFTTVHGNYFATKLVKYYREQIRNIHNHFISTLGRKAFHSELNNIYADLELNVSININNNVVMNNYIWEEWNFKNIKKDIIKAEQRLRT